jgi:hypothetical protein
MFSDVTPGEYTVTAVVEQYLNAEYGQRARGGKGTPITLKSGERLNSIDFEMIKVGGRP